MIAAFDIHDVNKAASAFNPEKLLWLNQQHMVRAVPAALVPYLRAQLRRLGCDSSDRALLEGVIMAQRERTKTMKEMAHNSRFLFVEHIEIDAKAAAKYLGGEGRDTLTQVRGQLDQLPQWNALAIHAALNDIATRLQSGLGKVAQPLRVAVTGAAVSPPIDVTLELLGRARTLERIDAALSRSGPGPA
jgi:glutamyl-tRNA synthetase